MTEKRTSEQIIQSDMRKKNASEDDRCDLDPGKKCDNCFRCLHLDALENSDYARIPIAAVYLDDEVSPD